MTEEKWKKQQKRSAKPHLGRPKMRGGAAMRGVGVDFRLVAIHRPTREIGAPCNLWHLIEGRNQIWMYECAQ